MENPQNINTMDATLVDPEAPLYQMVDDARFFVYSFNSTTLVATAGLALGLFFLITAIALYAYYYSTNTRRRNRSWDGYEDEENIVRSSSEQIAGVLDLLEKAWAMYGVSEQGCRRRLACEAHMLTAVGVEKPVANAIVYVMNRVTEADLTTADMNTAAAVRDLQNAAHYGREVQTCQPYEKHCTYLSINSVPQK